VSPRAAVLLAAQALANLALWIPLPIAVLWVASMVDYKTGSLLLGVLCAFAVLILGVRGGMGLVERIDAAWQDASSSAWREDALHYIATWCAVVGGGGFAVWLLLVGGMQSSIFPTN
jgi:hypothetical protein